MAALFAIRRRRMRTERVRRDPLAVLSDKEIIQEYRLSKAVILELSSLLGSDLERKNKDRTLTVLEQVLIFRSRITGRYEELRQKNQSQDKMDHSISRHFDLN